MTASNAWQGSERPPCPVSKPREPASPYLALFEAVFLLGGRDDLEGDGSLGLGLKGGGREAHGFRDQMLSESVSLPRWVFRMKGKLTASTSLPWWNLLLRIKHLPSTVDIDCQGQNK